MHITNLKNDEYRIIQMYKPNRTASPIKTIKVSKCQLIIEIKYSFLFLHNYVDLIVICSVSKSMNSWYIYNIYSKTVISLFVQAYLLFKYIYVMTQIVRVKLKQLRLRITN